MKSKITEQLKSIIKDKQFYSIMECMEFLWLIGYPMEQAYDTSCELYNPILNLDLSNLTNLSKKELLFCSNKELLFYSNLNKCHIGINTEYPYMIFYMKKKDIMFYQDLKNRCFYVNYTRIWKVFEDQYHMDYDKIQSFIGNLLEKGVKLKDCIPTRSFGGGAILLEKGVKLKDFKPHSNIHHSMNSLERGIKLKDYTPITSANTLLASLERGVKLKDFNLK